MPSKKHTKQRICPYKRQPPADHQTPGRVPQVTLRVKRCMPAHCERRSFAMQKTAFQRAIHGLSGCNMPSFTIRHAPHKKSAPHLRRAPTFYLNNTKLETLLFLCVSVRHTNHLYAGFWKASLSASVISIASSWPFGIGRR